MALLQEVAVQTGVEATAAVVEATKAEIDRATAAAIRGAKAVVNAAVALALAAQVATGAEVAAEVIAVPNLEVSALHLPHRQNNLLKVAFNPSRDGRPTHPRRLSFKRDHSGQRLEERVAAHVCCSPTQ